MEAIAFLIICIIASPLVFGATIGLILLVLPFFGKTLLDNPDKPEQIALFTAPEPGRSSIIKKGGSVSHVTHGMKKGDQIEEGDTFTNRWLAMYDRYSFDLAGVRFVGIPLIHQVHSYSLPRYRKTVSEASGEVVYEAVKPTEEGFRSNHFRTEMTAWYYKLPSVDIEGVHFLAIGAVYFRIKKSKVLSAAFDIDSWNTVLDQAIQSRVRNILRTSMSIDEAIGAVSTEISENRPEHDGTVVGNSHQGVDNVEEQVLTALRNYKIKDTEGTERTLEEAGGFEFMGHEVLDFSPQELTPEELVRLRSPALARREAQGRVLQGKAEAAFQREVLAALDAFPDRADANVNAEAFVKASKNGNLDMLVTAFAKKLLK